ncbi:WD40 repeat-like protein [Tothia fuscella]|uniref:WD40 repeat-like protein n=1 Tax=Tothia fuscella TaxID=1048955 RepID=A0A9P4NUA1_9PEZI|nr:WD40 repeat-like protein [Tothia fuscella]
MIQATTLSTLIVVSEAGKQRLPVTLYATKNGEIALSLEGGDVLVYYTEKEGKKLLRRHEDTVWAIASSADGKLYTGSRDATIIIWDLENGTAIQTLQGHTSTVRTLHVFSNGERLVSSSKDNTLQIWDLKTGDCVHVLEGHTANPWKVAQFGNLILSADTKGGAFIWDATTGKEVHALSGPSDSIYAVAMDAERSYTAGASNGDVRVWDNITGKCIAELQGHAAFVVRLDINDNFIATGDGRGVFKLWSKKTLDLHSSHDSQKDTVMDLAVSERWLVSAGKHGDVKVWDGETGDLVQHLRDDDDAAVTSEGTWHVFSVALSGEHVVVGKWFGEHPAIEEADGKT